MKLVADLHIHSHYSRATSKNLNFENLYKWAQIKGVNVVGSGDLSHPGWLQEMHDKLEPTEAGLFRLKQEFATAMDAEVPPACRAPVRFLLTGEVSNIYKRHDKVRKVHNVVFAPTLGAVAKIQARLEQIGNIRSDGRPILGLDSRDLLEIVLETDDECYLIPAHIWTPWFSMLGSKSGFDTVEECFGDLTDHIFALETGLSSDPSMNWRVSGLDGYTLVSNSDAHSAPKLAREATLFDTELSYAALFAALKTGDPATFAGTIEFFPEEGKYHHDGHRKCGVNWLPPTTIKHDGLCPVCGKKVTVGTLHRIETLADRPQGAGPVRRQPFHSLIPLPEIISELVSVGVNSKRVQREYFRLLGELGSELTILMQTPLDAIAAVGGERLAAGIGRMRQGEVVAEPGYDGEYGVIKLFNALETGASSLQLGMFKGEAKSGDAEERKRTRREPQSLGKEVAPNAPASPMSEIAETPLILQEQTALFDTVAAAKVVVPKAAESPDFMVGLNDDQRAAVLHEDGPLIIVAGPGTGKTRTLTHRIAFMITTRNILPREILAITFTNKAAQEMRERLHVLLGATRADRLCIKTFHAFGAMLLHEFGARIGLDETFSIIGEEVQRRLLKRLFPDLSTQAVSRALSQISAAKNRLLTPDATALAELNDEEPSAEAIPLAVIYRAYDEQLRASMAVDFDDLILRTVRVLEAHADVLQAVRARHRWISVDEYQDVNLAQVRLLQLLADDGTRLCAIGDPDQAIYGFRGADRRYFLDFSADYPGATTMQLSRNYRSTQTILSAAQQVIAHSPAQTAREIWSDFVSHTKVDVYQAATDKAEAEYAVHQIERMVGGTSYFSIDSGRVDDRGREARTQTARTFADFAILYRTGAQSHALLEAFDRSGIPYQHVGQTPLGAQKTIRLALAHLWLLHNPQAAIHLDLALNHPRELFTLEQLTARVELAQNQATPLWKTSGQASLTPAQRTQMAKLAQTMGGLADQDDAPVAKLVAYVRDELAKETALTEGQWVQFDRLERRAALFDIDLGGFLEASALQSATDDYDPRADRVSLMTLHASKGLEFPVVFIVGCEEGLLPYVRTGKITDTEEERRLFYVGMTRAQEQLNLAGAKKRFLFGQQMENAQSRFVNDIEQALKMMHAQARRQEDEKPSHVQLSLF